MFAPTQSPVDIQALYELADKLTRMPDSVRVVVEPTVDVYPEVGILTISPAAMRALGQYYKQAYHAGILV